jgi:hypothetical protein
MKTFRVQIDKTFEASSEEDALNQLQGEVGRMTRILGGGAEVSKEVADATAKGLSVKEVK